jgi:hypothetical protein
MQQIWQKSGDRKPTSAEDRSEDNGSSCQDPPSYLTRRIDAESLMGLDAVVMSQTVM